jgi:PAS domain S-box-containing protein
MRGGSQDRTGFEISALLERVANILARAESEADSLRAVAAEVAATLADRCTITLLSREPSGTERVLRYPDGPVGGTSGEQPHALADEHLTRRVLEYGTTLTVGATEHDDSAPPIERAFRTWLELSGCKVGVAVPVPGPDGPVGAVAVGWVDRSHVAGGADARLLERIAAVVAHHHAAATPMGVISLEGHFLRVNRALASVLGRGRDELMEIGPLAVTHPADRDRMVAMMGLMRAGSVQKTKFRQRWLAGGDTPVEALVSGSVIHGDDGAPCALAFTVERRASRGSRQSEWESLYTHSRQGIAVVGSDGRHARVNDAYGAILGYAPSELRGVPWLRTFPADCTADLQRAHAEMLRLGSASLETLVVRRDGSCFEAAVELVVNDDFDGSPRGHLCLIRELDERGRDEPWRTELVRLGSAEHADLDGRQDALTGLPDAGEFAERLEHALARAGGAPTAVLVIGVELPRTLPSPAGRNRRADVLRESASRVMSCLGATGIVARLGDGSFGICLPDGDELKAAALARSVLRAMTDPFVSGVSVDAVHATIGIAVTRHADDACELIDEADCARRRGRQLGSNRLELFDAEEGGPNSAGQQPADDLEGALLREELRLRYQPVFELTDRSICGVEVLLYWEHPSRTVLPPELFLPVARRSGAIIPIGRWVLEQSIRHFARWREEVGSERRLRLFVNVSTRELVSPSLPQSVAAALQAGDMAPEQLVLDIPEAALLHPRGAAGRSLLALRELGIAIAVDRFGTALSSAGDLGRHPIDLVKLDRSCVAGITEGGSERAVVRAVLGLAEASGLSVIACGVESERQVQALIELGADHAQGVLFAEPMAAPAVAKLLRWNGGRARRRAS